MKQIRSRMTYSNVISTLALFFAVAGGATAIAMSLPKNSVKSKQIAKEAVKTSKLAKDAATGDKVKESTLGKVPLAAHADSADTAGSAANAAHAAVADALGGSGGTVSPANLVQAQNVSREFGHEQLLELSVKGFGRYWLYCKPSGVVTFNYSSSLGTNVAIESGVLVVSEFPIETPEVFPIAGYVSDAGSVEYGTQDHRLSVHFTEGIIGSTRTLEIDGGGFDIGSGCAGQLHASVSG